MTTAGQRTFLERLSTLSKEEKFCDIQLEFSDGNRKFNRLLLAALSPFFDCMLSSAMKEGLSGVVKLPTVSSEVFDAVMTYYMEGDGELIEEVFYEAVDASEMMELPDLKELCIRNMTENLTPQSCVRIWQLSKRYTSDKILTERAMRLIVDNFEKVHRETDFLNLSKTDVIQIIKKLKHKILQEKYVFNAVLKWIEVNRPEEYCAKEIFKEVRLQFLQHGDILSKTFQYRDVLNKYKAIEAVIEEYAVDGTSSLQTSMHKDWTPELHNVIIVCSSTSKSVLHVYAWHLNEKKWYNLSTEIPDPIEQFTAAAARFRIVVSGGISGKVVTSDTRIFDTFAATWGKGPDLVEARYRHGAATVDDSVYVLGGYRSSHLNTIEKLSVSQEKWETVGNLFTAVVDPAVQSSGQNILIMGGEMHTEKGNGYISTIQCFNVESRSTSVIGDAPGRVITSAMSSPYIYLICLKNFPRSGINIINANSVASDQKLEYQKTEISIPSDLSLMYYTDIAFVVVDGVGVIYRSSSTRELDVTVGEDSKVALPTIPGKVKSVQCAFQTFVAERCLRLN